MKIKTIFLIFCILFATTWCEAASVTQANMRISAVDGTAFTDFSAAGTLTSYIGWYVKVYDSTGKTIEGYIKAAGTGETYTELLTNGSMETGDPPSSWTVNAGTFSRVTDTRTGGSGTYSGNLTATPGAQIYQQVTLTSGSLVYFGGWGKSNAGNTNCTIYLLTAATSGLIKGNTAISSISWTNVSTYATASVANPYFNVNGGSSGSGYRVDDLTAFKVLTPSTTGVTIVSAQGGATYNWAVKTSGFNYNDSSGYTYTLSATGFTGSTTGKLQ